VSFWESVVDHHVHSNYRLQETRLLHRRNNMVTVGHHHMHCNSSSQTNTSKFKLKVVIRQCNDYKSKVAMIIITLLMCKIILRYKLLPSIYIVNVWSFEYIKIDFVANNIYIF
jgi:hypothetical protein